MSGFFQRTRAIWLMVGVFAAALAGGLASGWLSGGHAGDEHPLAGGFFKAINAHATATNSSDALIVATGEIDTAVEGIFTLDALTGELRGAVMNPAKGKFVAFYKYSNLAQDFDTAKNPKFLMVTGLGELRSGYGPGKRAAHCIVYIAEVTSGRVIAYAVPWDQTAAGSPKGFLSTFYKVDAFSARDAAIRNP